MRTTPALIGALLLLLSPPSLAAEYLSSAQGTTHYEWAPGTAGPPVILVHGFSTPMWVWDPAFEALRAAGRPVLRFDLHGRGHSERAPVDTLASFHQQIEALREHLAIDRFDLVGMSMGGAISASYGAAYPERVRRLVLIAPFNSGHNIWLLGWPGWGEWISQHLFLPISLRWGYRRNFADPAGFFTRQPIYLERFRQTAATEDLALALLSSLRQIISRDQLHHYSAVGQTEIATLLIWGKQDRIVPYTESRRVHEALGKPEFLTVEGAGHLPHLEHAAQTLPPLLEFLAR